MQVTEKEGNLEKLLCLGLILPLEKVQLISQYCIKDFKMQITQIYQSLTRFPKRKDYYGRGF